MSATGFSDSTEGSGRVPPQPPGGPVSTSEYVVEAAGDYDPDLVFPAGRDQALVAVRVRAEGARLDFTLAATMVDEANARGFGLVREHPWPPDYLLLTFEVYDED